MKAGLFLAVALAKVHYWLVYILRKVLAIIELVLFLRVVLKFFSASSQSFVVALIYEFTDVIVWPFQSIFPDVQISGMTLDLVVISAMLGYLTVYFVCTRILGLLVRE